MNEQNRTSELIARLEGQLEEHVTILEEITRDTHLPASQRIAAIRQLQATLKLLDKKTGERLRQGVGSPQNSSSEAYERKVNFSVE